MKRYSFLFDLIVSAPHVTRYKFGRVSLCAVEDEEATMDREPDVIAYGVSGAVSASGTTRTRLYEAMRDGSLPYRKVGRRTLILRADLVAWIEGHPVVERAVSSVHR